MTSIDTNPTLLRRVEHFKRRAKDQATAIVQLRASRGHWRGRALTESRERQVWMRKAREQHARAELWKHRALHKFPIPAPRGGSPRFVDYEEARDYFEKLEEAS